MNKTQPKPVAAVVAAAGFSRRMGQFKQLLPWQGSTVIEAVVGNLVTAGAQPVLVITGHRGQEVAAQLTNTPARCVPNPAYETGEMLGSYQVGVRALLEGPETVSGALLALGDQPHIPVAVIRQVIHQAQATPEQIVIPSHRQRRGHPIYLPRRLWPELLVLEADQSLRDLLNRPGQDICYVDVETDAIRQDMDFPGEYEALLEKYKN